MALPASSHGHDRLIRKLETIATISDDERSALRDLPLSRRSFGADQEVVHDGDRTDHCCLLVEGIMQRYKHLGSGKRQIVSFHVSGDIADLQSLHLEITDHTIATLTPCVVAFISHQALRDLMNRVPRLASVFWRDTLIDGAVFREWIANVGSRPGHQRIAHLLCEWMYRLKVIGLAQGDGCELPLTQTVIGDATGLSTVHVNRMLQDLRGRGLIVTKGKFLHVPDWDKLQNFAGFDATYLHVREFDAA